MYANEAIKRSREFRVAEKYATGEMREEKNNENSIVESRHRDWNRSRREKGTVALIFTLRTSSFVLSAPRVFSSPSSRWLAHSSRDENFCQGRKSYFFFSVTCREFSVSRSAIECLKCQVYMKWNDRPADWIYIIVSPFFNPLFYLFFFN